eukprot:jgi/Botrbrau1/23068/Bobra.0243s0009.1
MMTMQKPVLLCGLLLGLGYATLALGAGIKMPPGMEEEIGKRSDVKYIKCGACEQLAKNAYRMARELREELKPGKQLDEFVLIEKVEKLGNPNKDEGEWISTLDMVEDGKRIRLVEMDEIGKCGVECKTIQMAVDGILESADTDIAESSGRARQQERSFRTGCVTRRRMLAARRPRRFPPTGPRDPSLWLRTRRSGRSRK